MHAKYNAWWKFAIQRIAETKYAMLMFEDECMSAATTQYTTIVILY